MRDRDVSELYISERRGEDGYADRGEEVSVKSEGCQALQQYLYVYMNMFLYLLREL